ncbi:MAG: Allergen V5/Tpx family protein [Bacteroidetes bacterium]|nr:Allergen V5/Tpx family protein [Bacteroidota bacterium]
MIQQFLKPLIGSYLFLLLFLTKAIAQDCDKVLSDGVFNTTSINSSTDISKAFNEYIYSSDFSSHQQAIDAGLSVGTVVYGVPLQIGGTFSKQQKDQWRSTHQQYKNETLNSSQKYSALFKYASSDILDAWTTCQFNASASKVGLYGWLQEVSPSASILHLTWLPMAGDGGAPPKVTNSSISGGYRSDNINSPVLPNGYILLQGANGNLVGITRKPNEDLVVIVNTSRGDIPCYLKAYPKPSIINFSSTSANINFGESATLSWTTNRATQVSINNNIGNVQPNGSTVVSPQLTTTYKITATNTSGTINGFTTINVIPLPPTLTSGSVSFRTTDNDKDDNTNVSVFIKSGGNTVANWSGSDGHWNDNSDHGPYGLSIINHIRKDQLIGPGQAVLVEAPTGHDEWHFNWSVTLNFSDGSSKRYDWGGGNVDHDRTTITQPLP